MKICILIILVLLAGVVSARATIKGEEVQYSAEGTSLKGYLAYDDAVKGKHPGILVVHEWWGHNEYSRKRARLLAELGYTALAVDMYGEGKQASHPDDAGKFATAVMQNLGTAKVRFMSALELLRKHKTVDSNRIAAIGYCFGGGVVLHMARMGVDLKGVVSFHGSYGTQMPAQAGKVNAAVLVCHGADDQFATAEQIAAFKQEMEKAGVDYQFITYEGAKHSFTNPQADEYAKQFNIPLGYSESADKKSWEDMKQFLEKVFAK